MKKYFNRPIGSCGFFFALVICLMFAFNANAANYNYNASVYKLDNTATQFNSTTRITTGITYKVLTVNTDTAATLTVFKDRGLTALTNPVTTTVFAAAGKNRVRFQSTASSVDIIVTDTNGGYTAIVRGFTANDHKIVIDERPNVVHHGMIWFGASDNAATDTGVNIIPDTFIQDMWVEVVTVDASETISVGTEDTAAGFRTGVSVATAGYITDTGVITGGSNIDYVPASTYGALLATTITGSDAVVSNGGRSMIYHVVTTSGTDDDLYYTGSAGSDTAAGYIHYFFTRMR